MRHDVGWPSGVVHPMLDRLFDDDHESRTTRLEDGIP